MEYFVLDVIGILSYFVLFCVFYVKYLSEQNICTIFA